MNDIVIDNPTASGAKVLVSLRMPKSLQDQIQAYAKERDLPNTSDAYRDLLEFALVAKSEQKDGIQGGHSVTALANVMESLKQELRGDFEWYAYTSSYSIYQSLSAVESILALIAKSHNIQLPPLESLRAQFSAGAGQRLADLALEISGRNSDA